MKNKLEELKKNFKKNEDYIFKEITVKKHTFTFIFCEVLISSQYVNDFILRNVPYYTPKEIKNLKAYLPDTIVKEITFEEISFYINNAFVVLVTDNKILAIEARLPLDRGVSTVENELTIQGPKDSFTETFNLNLGLIRKRIKSDKLACKNMIIGRRTSTKVGLLYIDDIADKELVKKVETKLKKVDIDGIIDSSYLKGIMEERKHNLFPTVISTERPDRVSMALLEGKIAIVVDTSPDVLLLPNFFIDFFHTVDDYYQKSVNISFIRLIRVCAFISAIFIPAFYIAVSTHNQSMISFDLLLNLKAQRENVPIPSVLEALIMTISFEILRESDIRMSSTTGSAISILGGLILGDAAVNAGIMSPIMIIIIAISAIAGLVFSSIEMVNAIRMWRLIMLLLASLLGIYGIFLGGIYLLTKLISITSFDKPYLAPFFPFLKDEQKDAILKVPNKKEKYRNPLLTTNRKRGRYE